MKSKNELKVQVNSNESKVIINNDSQVELYKIDLTTVGHTIGKDDEGNTMFMCNLLEATKDEIFLKVLLTCFEPNYKVTGHICFHCDECDTDHVIFFTDMPYDYFCEEMENC